MCSKNVSILWLYNCCSLIQALIAQIEIVLKPSEISILVDMRPVLRGQLFAPIKKEGSTWYLDGRILVVLLLKSNRRGHYKDGCTNAATFWPSVLSKPAPDESLPVSVRMYPLRGRFCIASMACSLLRMLGLYICRQAALILVDVTGILTVKASKCAKPYPYTQ